MQKLNGYLLYGVLFVLIVSACEKTPHPVPGESGASNGEDFSIVLFPDTQYYARQDSAVNSTTNTYQRMAEWVRKNHDEYARDIKYVIHLGDVTEMNTDAEWEIAVAAHQILNMADIPYIMTLGNHDYDIRSSYTPMSGGTCLLRESSRYKDHFIPEMLGTAQDGPETHYSDRFENYYRLFEVEHEDVTLEFMIMALEFCPRKDVLAWANRQIAAHPNRRVIVVTHSYLYYDGTYYDHASASYYLTPGREPQNIWDELIKRHSNIFMVLCGHTNGATHNEKKVPFKSIDGTSYDHTVIEVLADYQYEPLLNSSTYYGNGWLRVLNFKPGQNKIEIETLSIEAGNNQIFMDGDPVLYLADYMERDATVTIDYDLTRPVRYISNTSDHTFHDMAVSSTAKRHLQPDIAGTGTGGFVVAWTTLNDDNQSDIYVKAYDPDGHYAFQETKVNTESGQHTEPAVAMASNGDFIVVWTECSFEATPAPALEADKQHMPKTPIKYKGCNIFGRIYSAGRKNFLPQFSLNMRSAGRRKQPDVAMNSRGDCVVAWAGDADGDGLYTIMIRGVDAGGRQRFFERPVTLWPTVQQRNPAIALSDQGSFVVVFEEDSNMDGNFDIFGCGYTSVVARSWIFNKNIGNAADGGHYGRPEVAMAPDRNFIVVWEGRSDTAAGWKIYGRSFDGAGRPNSLHDNWIAAQLSELDVLQTDKRCPVVAMNATGRIAMAWQENMDVDGLNQIKSIFYIPGDDRQRQPEIVNYVATGDQQLPGIVLSDDDYLISTWEDDMDRDMYPAIMANKKRVVLKETE